MTKDMIQEIRCNIERRLKDMMIQEPEKYEEITRPVHDGMKKAAAAAKKKVAAKAIGDTKTAS